MRAVAGPAVTAGGTATFTVTMTDQNLNANFTPIVNSGTISSGACTTSPCVVRVTGMREGIVVLIISAGNVEDLAGNTNSLTAAATLTAQASSLSINSLDMITSSIASNYPVSGSCEPSQGDVSVTIGTPEVTQTGGVL